MINTALCDEKRVPVNQTTVSACNFTPKSTVQCTGFTKFYKSTEWIVTVGIIPVNSFTREYG